jgi:hypothetical protein
MERRVKVGMAAIQGMRSSEERNKAEKWKEKAFGK